MAELGLVARVRRKPRSLTRRGKQPAAPDLVRRTFTAPAADVLWCGDVTQIDTDEGKLYLATVEDLFSRRLLGYAMSGHHDAALTCASLQMAAATRGGADDIAAVAAALNARPRKSLGWRTPAEAFNDHLDSLLSSNVATTP
ncbi:DDE-type integrase/transposase/recombinase [Nonomuraea rubra]